MKPEEEKAARGFLLFFRLFHKQKSCVSSSCTKHLSAQELEKNHVSCSEAEQNQTLLHYSWLQLDKRTDLKLDPLAVLVPDPRQAPLMRF